MAPRVVWSPAALEDVDAVASYIARDSAHYAAATVRRLLQAGRQLEDFPQPGRAVPEFDDETLRERIVSHGMIYRVEGPQITIAAVVHEKQSFEAGAGRVRSR